MAASLLVLGGPPCSGKSSIAASVQKHLGFRWLQLDLILHKLIPNSLHGRDDRDVAYRAMHLLAEEMLRSGHSTVLDATYSSSEQRASVEAIAANLAIRLYLVECHVSPDMAADRFKKRGPHPARDLTEALVRDVASRYCYFGNALTINETDSCASGRSRVEDYLREGEPLRPDGRWPGAARGYARTA